MTATLSLRILRRGRTHSGLCAVINGTFTWPFRRCRRMAADLPAWSPSSAGTARSASACPPSAPSRPRRQARPSRDQIKGSAGLPGAISLAGRRDDQGAPG
jgi:hypothetical protein